MAHKYYNLVGDNGYGLFTSWDDLQEKAYKLEGHLHFYGFSTAKEAYNDILKTVVFRWRIRQAGVIDMPSLLKKQFVLLDADEAEAEVDAEEREAPATTVGSIQQKAVSKGGRVCRKRLGTLAELLAEDEDDLTTPAQTEDPEKEKLLQLFTAWYENYKNEPVKKDESKEQV